MTVLDASFALSLVLPDEGAPPHIAPRDLAYAVVPSLWIYEVTSGLNVAVRRGRIDTTDADRALQYFHALSLESVHPRSTDIMECARVTGLTVYDASYLVVAQQLGTALATHDDALASAARSQGIDLYGE